MSLEDMSLKELQELSALVGWLKEIGEGMPVGAEARFCLMPGEDAVVRLCGLGMPELCAAHEDLFGPSVDAPGDSAGAEQITHAMRRIILEDMGKPSLSRPDAAGGAPQPDVLRPLPEFPSPPAEADAAPPRAADEAPAEEVAPSSSADVAPLNGHHHDFASDGEASSGAEPAEGGAGALLPARATDAEADPRPVMLSTPGEAGGSWTEDDDARMITMVVGAIVACNMTRSQAVSEAAIALKRSDAAVSARLYGRKLLPRFDAALEEARREAGGQQQLAVTPADQKPTSVLEAYLWGLPRDDRSGWSWEDDKDLMQLACAGLDPAAIGLDMGRVPAVVKGRFELLTGYHKDDAGKWQRRFTREEVLAALEARLGQQVQV